MQSSGVISLGGVISGYNRLRTYIINPKATTKIIFKKRSYS